MKCKYCKKLYSRVDGHVCQHHTGIYAAQQKVKKALTKPAKKSEVDMSDLITIVEIVLTGVVLIALMRHSYRRS